MITPLQRPHGKQSILLLRMPVYSFVAWQQTSYCSVRFLVVDRIENTVSPIFVVTFLRGVFTGVRRETPVLLLLPVFVAVGMFTDIPLLLRNLATDCLPRICLRGNLFTNPLPSNQWEYMKQYLYICKAINSGRMKTSLNISKKWRLKFSSRVFKCA
jgi:hypothetical protein